MFPSGPAAARGATAFTLIVGLVSVRSRGVVRLASPGPLAPPVIDPGYLADRRDAARLLDGIGLARRLAATPPLRDHLEDELWAPGAEGDELRAAMTSTLTGYQHPVGTCRMGPADDPDAVVGPTGRVHGVDGLFVVDASTMPEAPPGQHQPAHPHAGGTPRGGRPPLTPGGRPARVSPAPFVSRGMEALG